MLRARAPPPRKVDLTGFFARERDLMLKREEFNRTADLPRDEEEMPHYENCVSKSKVTQAITNRMARREHNPPREPIWDGDGRLLEDLSAPPSTPSAQPITTDQSPTSRTSPSGIPSFIGRPPLGSPTTSDPEPIHFSDKEDFQIFIKRQNQSVKAKHSVKPPLPENGPWSCRVSVIIQQKLEREERGPSPLKDRAEDPTFEPDTSATRDFPTPVAINITDVECYSQCRELDRAMKHMELHAHDTDGCTFHPENPRPARRKRLAERRKRRPERPVSTKPDSEEEELQRIQKVREDRAKYLRSQEKRKKGPFRIPFEREQYVEIDVRQRTIKPW
jgi:hypothetical protein